LVFLKKLIWLEGSEDQTLLLLLKGKPLDRSHHHNRVGSLVFSQK
jgi:hypothetical protein